jgi:hypothetical protein
MEMSKSMRIQMIWLLLLGASMQAQISGRLTGVVTDENGRPLPGARVHLWDLNPALVRQIPQYHESDAQGRFSIAHVPWGSYAVFAGKEADGYADTFASFYQQGSGYAPTVVFTSLSPVQEITVRLGPRTGVLKITSVTDASTGKDINSSGIIVLRQTKYAKRSLTTSTTYDHILVPSLTEVSLEISAPGYKVWGGNDETHGNTHIQLQPDEILKLEVKLERESSSPTVAELLDALGKNKDRIFTMEEGETTASNPTPLHAYHLTVPADQLELMDILNYMTRTVPNLTYHVDSRNSHVIHVIDGRLVDQQGYALDKLVDKLKFSGPAYGLIGLISSSGSMTWMKMPSSNDLLITDFNQDVSIDEHEISLRDALSQLSPAAKHGGGFLWMAKTQSGQTFLSLCCASQTNKSALAGK